MSASFQGDSARLYGESTVSSISERFRASSAPEDPLNQSIEDDNMMRISYGDVERSESWHEIPALSPKSPPSDDSTSSTQGLMSSGRRAALDLNQIYDQDSPGGGSTTAYDIPSLSLQTAIASDPTTTITTTKNSKSLLDTLFASASMDPSRPGQQQEKEKLQEMTWNFFESTWVFLLFLGILASFTAWSVDQAVDFLAQLHTKFTNVFGKDTNWLVRYVLYVLFRVFLVLLGVLSTFYVCPNAAGSGIPEMRSILGGFPLPNYLRGRTLIAKSFGLVCALGSGLSIGKEGPFVHLSSVIAQQLLTRWSLFQSIKRSNDLTHHVLAAACAVGVTATFGAPIGGVLFSIEVTTTYYVTSNYWRAFFSSVVGVVVFRTLNNVFSKGKSTSEALFTTSFDVLLPYHEYELIFFLILAIVCGLLAACFVRLYRFVFDFKHHFIETKYMASNGFFQSNQDLSQAKIQKKTRRTKKKWTLPFVYAAFVAFVFAAMEFPVGSFMLLTQRQVIDDMFSIEQLNYNKTFDGNNTTSSRSNGINTGNGTSNGTAVANNTMSSAWTSPSLCLNLLVYIIVRFFSTTISATVMVPSGIATPVFAIGAVIGRLFGELIVFLGGRSHLAAGYAVVGAASFTAGVTGTVSIAVIVFELTSQLNYMIPVLLSVLVGRAVALFFSLDMYETISRQKNLPQWPDLTKQKSYALTASDLMRHEPLNYWVLRRQTYQSLKKLLEESPEEVNVFPVIDDEQTMIYLGVIDREEIESLLDVWHHCLSSTTTGIYTSESSGPVVLGGQLLIPTPNSAAAENTEIVIESQQDRVTGRQALHLDLHFEEEEEEEEEEDEYEYETKNSSFTPTSHRQLVMTSQLALAGVNSKQQEALSQPNTLTHEPVDLVKLEIFSLDSVNFHVHRDTFASHVILLVAVHKCPQLFVTARGKLMGVIHSNDLLAQTRRFTL